MGLVKTLDTEGRNPTKGWSYMKDSHTPLPQLGRVRIESPQCEVGSEAVTVMLEGMGSRGTKRQYLSVKR